MKTTIKNTDYYPVQSDIRDISNDTDEATKLLEGDELLSFVIRNKLTPFQSFVLVVKNTFEAHILLVHDLRAADLNETGIFRMNVKTGQCIDLSCDFFQFLETYTDGLRQIWMLLSRHHHLEEISFNELLLFVIANGLYKFPVAELHQFDLSGFISLSEKTRHYYSDLAGLSNLISTALAEVEMVRQVNDQYDELFEEVIGKLGAKETLLIRLNQKLELANNPLITNEEELDREFFKEFVEKESRANSGGSKCRNIVLTQEYPDLSPKEDLSEKIKVLYRIISKNCREVHTSVEKSEDSVVLQEIFMKTNFIYNDTGKDMVNQFFQWFNLVRLLTEVINFRKDRELPVLFPEHNTLTPGIFPIILNKELINRIKHAIENHLYWQKISQNTEYKIKHIADAELAGLHKEFLMNQIAYFDNKIIEKTMEIKNIMRLKK